MHTLVGVSSSGAWTCPSCGRRFRRRGQSHECAPAMTLDEYFGSGPEHERPIFDVVFAHLQSLGPVHVEPVSVGIFFKRAQTFAELRPKDRWEALSFSLSRRVSHPRIRRKVVAYGSSFYHIADLRSPDDFDDDIRSWLTEAYLRSPS